MFPPSLRCRAQASLTRAGFVNRQLLVCAQKEVEEVKRSTQTSLDALIRRFSLLIALAFSVVVGITAAGAGAATTPRVAIDLGALGGAGSSSADRINDAG
jgi:hypothetical protein